MKMFASTLWTWAGGRGFSNLAFAPDAYLGWSAAERDVSNEAGYTAAYVQDTLTLGRFTAEMGLRYDLQEGRQNATVIDAPPVDAGGVLGGTFAGADPGFEWESISPRLGSTSRTGPAAGSRRW